MSSVWRGNFVLEEEACPGLTPPPAVVLEKAATIFYSLSTLRRSRYCKEPGPRAVYVELLFRAVGTSLGQKSM